MGNWAMQIWEIGKAGGEPVRSSWPMATVHAASQSSAGMSPSAVVIRFMVAPSGEHPQTITMDRPPQTINAPHDDRERRVGRTSGAEVDGHRTAGRGTLRDHSSSSRI